MWSTEAARILDREIPYEGESISIRSIEHTIARERTIQGQQVSELNTLRERNDELQVALGDEMKRLREISDAMRVSRHKQKGWFSSVLSWINFGRDDGVNRTSVEALLRGQFEVSMMRLREAADFSDRLEAARVDLYDEIDRLNARIVSSAKNEELAADYVRELRTLRATLEVARDAAAPSSAEEREATMLYDRTQRLLAEHTMKLKLYSTAEERIDRLKQNTRLLAETISHLQSDIARYVTAAGERLDLVAGQIQAVGAAADAANVMFELKESLDTLTESMNLTTQFVVETQQYFRENVDSMIDDLEVYDERTNAMLSSGLISAEVMGELDVEDALASALAREIEALAEGDVVLEIPETVGVEVDARRSARAVSS